MQARTGTDSRHYYHGPAFLHQQELGDIYETQLVVFSNHGFTTARISRLTQHNRSWDLAEDSLTHNGVVSNATCRIAATSRLKRAMRVRVVGIAALLPLQRCSGFTPAPSVSWPPQQRGLSKVLSQRTMVTPLHGRGRGGGDGNDKISRGKKKGDLPGECNVHIFLFGGASAGTAASQHSWR
jgi:hypothetical protein